MIIHASTAGNDSNDGLSPETAKLTLQAAVNAANPGGIVYADAGTYTLTTALLMQPNVKLQGAPGTTITQGNAANLTSLIDFATNSANGASLLGCIVDGNGANQTPLTGSLVTIGRANDVSLANNTFQNAPGNAVVITTGLRPRIQSNTFTAIYLYAISMFTGVGNYPTHGNIVGNKFLPPIGYHVMGIVNSNGNLISQNKITGSQIGNSANPVRLSISGTAITWVSGPDFTNVTPGMFITVNAGTPSYNEILISAKLSNTSLTASASAGTYTNIVAIIGTGDMIGIDSSSENIFSDNEVSLGATTGCGVSNSSGGADARRNRISGNHISLSGQCGIAITDTASIFIVSDTLITNNIVTNPAQSGAAGPGGGFNSGISVGGTAAQTTLVGNVVTDDQATKTAAYWLALWGVNAGQVIVGTNISNGPLSEQAILGGIYSIALSAGWGTGAAVSNVVSYGSSFSFTIRAGANPGLYPALTVITVATSSSPIGAARAFLNASGAQAQFVGDQAMGPGTKNFTYIGTPTAGALYTFYLVGAG